VSDVFSAESVGMGAHAATHHAAGAHTAAHCSADSQAMLAAAAAALGPIGASYLAAYAPAQANNLAAGLLVSQVLHTIGDATVAADAAFHALDA
jgi:hypothetical protein